MQIGDKVKLTLVGKIVDATGFGDLHDDDGDLKLDVEGMFGHLYIKEDAEGVESFEVIEPPVVTFGPGDVVAYNYGERPLYALGTQSFIRLDGNGAGDQFPYGAGFRRADQFTSKDFTKIELSR